MSTVPNPKIKWNKSPSSNVAAYVVVWHINMETHEVTVERTQDQDDNGYELMFTDNFPTRVLNIGDSVGASVCAVRYNPEMRSVIAFASTITIQPEVIHPPTNVRIEMNYEQ